MAEQKLQTARQLITEKRYAEARTLLQTIDHPTATKWLARLDEIAPEPKVKPLEARSGDRGNLVLLALLSILTLVIALYGAFLRPTPASPDVAEMVDAKMDNVDARLSVVESDIVKIDNVDSRLSEIESDMGQLVAATVRQQAPATWEYLSLQYSQVQAYEANQNPLELVSVDRAEYMLAFDNGCNLDDDCMRRNFRGMSYYLDVLGADGWELVAINNTSTSIYSAEIYFKRPRQ